jgi:hypothetical protein
MSIVIGRGDLNTYADSCDESDAVQKMYCTKCSSKLFTQTTSSDRLVNMGPLFVDSSIPLSYSKVWKQQLKNELVESPKSNCSWMNAVPQHPSTNNNKPSKCPILVTGGCSCGTCRYQFSLSGLTEFQHCYCQLCRQ